ncbi:hypothetical protein DC429_04085 [Arthrobacter sp. TPD3018]|uniref:hypothetical protein n=1 Tax=Bacteria TaxID=2 RepID=UPI000D516E5D|nr:MULTISPECIES: hypothetical protein [Bacteria]PVE59582.1 hypothetical protein DC425_04080 [Sphingomonas sp. TPD3009]PVE61098.1 hypothetical protein DC429_04085 [Arthrobacter sp. TPD3018]PVE85983.1 hypothetical protein DC431_09095 [Sphingomonas melonis]
MAPRIDHYDWSGGHEALLRFGPDTGPAVILALPLFEEANRTRTFAVDLLRRLAEQGIAGLLPDVPGQGESLVPLEDCTRFCMAEALEALTDRCLDEGRRTYAVGIRSGTLLDYCALHSGRWHLAPQDGEALLRDLHRTWRAAGNDGDPQAMMYGADTVEIAGNVLSSNLLTSFSAAAPFNQAGTPRRVVRLSSDSAPADRHVEAAPLWRRAEPGHDPALAATLAADIADWIAACEV